MRKVKYSHKCLLSVLAICGLYYFCYQRILPPTQPLSGEVAAAEPSQTKYILLWTKLFGSRTWLLKKNHYGIEVRIGGISQAHSDVTFAFRISKSLAVLKPTVCSQTIERCWRILPISMRFYFMAWKRGGSKRSFLQLGVLSSGTWLCLRNRRSTLGMIGPWMRGSSIGLWLIDWIRMFQRLMLMFANGLRGRL